MAAGHSNEFIHVFHFHKHKKNGVSSAEVQRVFSAVFYLDLNPKVRGQTIEYLHLSLSVSDWWIT